MSRHPILKVIAKDGCRSYLIGCPDTGAALIVDPKSCQHRLYESLLAFYGLELKAVLDTHTHADHLSGSAAFICDGVPLWMSAETGVQREKRGLVHGEELQVGELRFQVLALPGHTADSIGLHGHGMLLSGDSLLIGGLARADFVGSNPAQLYDSVQQEIMTLPGDTLVLPGHDYGDLLFSTIAAERELNTALTCADGATYAAQLCAVEGAGNSASVDETLALNLQANPSLPSAPKPAATCCASPAAATPGLQIAEISPTEARGVHSELQSAEQWVDVRDPHEFAHGRISNTINLPLGELGFHLERLRSEEPLYLSCRSGVRSMTAAKTLLRLGVAAKPVNVGGGILGWQNNGYEIEGLPAR